MDTIYHDIATRTDGDIYIGVVGPVRTGKSTFIKKFMETLVLPNMDNEFGKERTRDEMPQSAAGRTVMTTEPKFIPNEAVEIKLDGNASFKVKMIDCVGYIVPGALGLFEEGQPRMVMTPWAEEAIPFEQAAEIGTKKVINEHSTIGFLVTTDGTIGELPRENYVNAEARVVNELKAINKPFVIILNSANPDTDEAINYALELENKYKTPVALVNCTEINEEDIRKILELVLLEFPIREINIKIPKWVDSLSDDHELKKEIYSGIIKNSESISRVGEVKTCFDNLTENDFGATVIVKNIDLSSGRANLELEIPEDLFYKILGEETGFVIDGEESLINIMTELSQVKKNYDKIADALQQVNETGYGIVSPSIDDLTLEEPEIVKQAGGYGVKLRASAPSIHMTSYKQKLTFPFIESGTFLARKSHHCA